MVFCLDIWRSHPLKTVLAYDFGGTSLLRSPYVSAGKAAAKGLGESTSHSEKAVGDRPNLLGLGRTFSSLCGGLNFLRDILRV